MTSESEDRVEELKEWIKFLRRTLVGLDDHPHVRIMRKELEKAEGEYFNLTSKSRGN